MRHPGAARLAPPPVARGLPRRAIAPAVAGGAFAAFGAAAWTLLVLGHPAVAAVIAAPAVVVAGVSARDRGRVGAGSPYHAGMGSLVALGFVALLVVKDLAPGIPAVEQPIRALGAPARSLAHAARSPDLPAMLRQTSALLLGLALVLAVRAAIRARRLEPRHVLTAVLGAVWLVAAVVALRSLGWPVELPALASKNAVATVLAVGLVLHVHVWRVAWPLAASSRLALAGAGFVVLSFELVAMNSVTGVIAATTGAFAYAALATSGNREIRLRVLLAAGALAALAAGLALAANPVLLTRTSGLASDFRWTIWRDCLGVLGVAPWFGIGAGAFPAVHPLVTHLTFAPDAFLAHPDSSYVLLVLEWGIVPTAVALVLGVVLVARRRRGPLSPVRIAALAALASLAAAALSDPTFHRAAIWFIACVLAAIALPASRRERSISAAASAERRWPVRWDPAGRFPRASAASPWEGMPTFGAEGRERDPAGSRASAWLSSRLSHWRAPTAVPALAVLALATLGWSARHENDLGWRPLSASAHASQGAERWRAHPGDPHALAHLRAAVALKPGSPSFAAFAARTVHAADPAQAREFWRLALARGQDAAGVWLSEARTTFPGTPVQYWAEVALAADSDVVLQLADADADTARRCVEQWLDRRRASAGVPVWRQFVAAARRAAAADALARGVAAMPADAGLRCEAARALQALGDDAAAWGALALVYPRPGAVRGPAPTLDRNALLALRMFRELEILCSRPEYNGEAALDLLREVCLRPEAPPTFRVRYAWALADQQRWRDAVSTVLSVNRT